MRSLVVVFLAVCVCALLVPGLARPAKRCKSKGRDRESELSVFGDKIFIGDLEDLEQGGDGGEVSREDTSPSSEEDNPRHDDDDELCDEETSKEARKKHFKEKKPGKDKETSREGKPSKQHSKEKKQSKEKKPKHSKGRKPSKEEWSDDEWFEWSEEWDDMSDEDWEEDMSEEFPEESDEWGEETSEEDFSEETSESNETDEEHSDSNHASEELPDSDEANEEILDSSEMDDEFSESDEASEESSEETAVLPEVTSTLGDETISETPDVTEAPLYATDMPVYGTETSVEGSETPLIEEGTEDDQEQPFLGGPPLVKKTAMFESLEDNSFLINNLTHGMMYLRDFGWFEPDDRFDMITDTQTMSAGMRRSIMGFQKFAGIPMTGDLDGKTMEMMRQPRCGFADSGKKLASYTTLGSKWRRNALTYRILNHTPDLTVAQVEAEMRRALDTWSEQTPLRFRQIPGNSNTRSDIEISFAAYSHGDGNSFDGDGGTLAHAYGPAPGIGGDTHFDESETWTINRGSGRPRGIDLFQVAAHEFGHALGLGHSQERLALMAPFYRYQADFRLHSDDIRGIQRLYGGPVEEETPAPPEPPRPQPPPTRRPPPPPATRAPPPPGGDRDALTCSEEAFDAFTRLANGSVYAFRGRYFWRLNSQSADPGYPMLIGDVWDGLPADGIDAALYWPPNRKTYFFKGAQYWRFDGDSPDPGYPRGISAWRTVPNIDAALFYGEYQGKSRAYFFKGNQYWRYTQGRRSQDRGYPRPISAWGGFPSRLHAAIKWTNDHNYIFEGDRYWRLDEGSTVTGGTNPYPRSVAEYWMGC